MGLTFTANYKNAPQLSGGYRMIFTFRKEVALAWDRDFGEHYSGLFALMLSTLHPDTTEFDKRTIEILQHERFKDEDIDILEFLFAPDNEGFINHKTAKKVYELIKDLNPRTTLRYTYFSKNDWEDLKELLKGCYSHRAYFKWR